MSGVEVSADRAADHVVVRWSDGRSSGSCRFDHLPGTTPEWLGSADELLEGADLGRWAAAEGLELGIWHDDAGVELL